MNEYLLKVESVQFVSSGDLRIDFSCDSRLPKMIGGQFLNLEVPDSAEILRRPFCIFDCGENFVTVFVAVVGKGTRALTKLKKGDCLRATLPLGNGFYIDDYKNIALLGGGIGAAALHLVSKTMGKMFTAFFALTPERMFFEAEFLKTCNDVKIFSRSGSCGVKGNVIDNLLAEIENYDAVLVCGSHGLVRDLAAKNKSNVPILVSTEQRMACGIGACLVCTCGMNDGTNRRVCTDGPVFDLADLKLD